MIAAMIAATEAEIGMGLLGEGMSEALIRATSVVAAAMIAMQSEAMSGAAAMLTMTVAMSVAIHQHHTGEQSCQKFCMGRACCCIHATSGRVAF